MTDSGPAVFSNSFLLHGAHTSIEKLSLKDKSNNLYLLFIFCPTFFIQNLLPCAIQLVHQPQSSIILTLLPGETKEFGLNPKTLGKIQITLELETPVPSAWQDLTAGVSKIGFPSNKNKIVVDCAEYNIFSHLPGFDPISRNINCKLFQIYSRYLIINKTFFPLEIKKNVVLEKNSISMQRLKKDKIKMRTFHNGKPTN